MTIAHGMLAACGAEFDQQVNVYSRYLEDLEGKEKVARAARQTGLDISTELVLKNRKTKRP